MNLLDWRNKKEWISAISVYAGDIINENLVEKIRSSDLEGCWSDDMSWLQDEDIVDCFRERLLTHYSHVKAFHGCRPISVRSYYDNGFLGQNKGSIEKQFRELFSDVESNLVEQAISDLNERGISEKGKIYFVCSELDLIECSGHYLIQGSEYIMAMAASLCRLSSASEDYRFRLREAGIPTVFEVNIPISQIPWQQINGLVKVILASWGTLNLFPDDEYERGMSFVLHSNLEAEHISNHIHPSRIKDQHGYTSWYRPKITSCEMCK